MRWVVHDADADSPEIPLDRIELLVGGLALRLDNSWRSEQSPTWRRVFRGGSRRRYVRHVSCLMGFPMLRTFLDGYVEFERALIQEWVRADVLHAMSKRES
jgi:hypothetical protein